MGSVPPQEGDIRPPFFWSRGRQDLRVSPAGSVGRWATSHRDVAAPRPSQIETRKSFASFFKSCGARGRASRPSRATQPRRREPRETVAPGHAFPGREAHSPAIPADSKKQTGKSGDLPLLSYNFMRLHRFFGRGILKKPVSLAGCPTGTRRRKTFPFAGLPCFFPSIFFRKDVLPCKLSPWAAPASL